MKTKRLNMNDFAKIIAQEETGKKEVSIAQIKEVMKIIAREIYNDTDLLIGFLKYGGK